MSSKLSSSKLTHWHNWGREVAESLREDYSDWPFEKSTVVLCCKNKERDLALVLPALFNQVQRADKWILADDYSDDNSEKAFVDFCEHNSVPFAVVKPPKRGVFQLNTLRNLGFQNALDGLVIVIDADLLVGPGFVQAHLRLHLNALSPASSVGPLFEAADPSGKGPINFMWGHEGWAHVNHSSTDRVPTWATVLGGNLGLHRRTWERVGNFDTIYDGNYGVDDQDFHYRLFLCGVIHVGDFEAHAIHLPHDNVVSATRSGNVNLKKFERKYGISVYEGRNIPAPIDWLGWQNGPWNKVAKRMILGEAQAVRKRGTLINSGTIQSENISISPSDITTLNGLIDERFIRDCYGDTPQDLLNAFLHDARFFEIGPNSLVDMTYISSVFPIERPQIHPFLLFIAAGLLEKLGASRLFQSALYRELARDIAPVPQDQIAFSHFWNVGRHLGLPPHPLFAATKNPFWLTGSALDKPVLGRCFFDSEYYRTSLDEALPHGADPIVHYLNEDRGKQRSPNPKINLEWLNSRYGYDIRDGLDPLTWYITEGATRGAQPTPTFGAFPRDLSFTDRQKAMLNFIEVDSKHV